MIFIVKLKSMATRRLETIFVDAEKFEDVKKKFDNLSGKTLMSITWDVRENSPLG